MKTLLLTLSILFSTETFASVCNKSIIVVTAHNTGTIGYTLSDDNRTPAPNCSFLYKLKKEATDVDCANIAIYQGYKCGQTINEVIPVYETDMSYSTYLQVNSCWACK